MPFDLQTRPDASYEKLSLAHDFPTLLEAAFSIGLLSQNDLARLMGQCVPLLEQLTRRCTRGESSSVPVAKAQELAASLFYCVYARLRREPSPFASVTLLCQTPLEQLYQSGLSLVKQQVRSGIRLLGLVQRTRLHTPNIAYNDTLMKGLPPFFSRYHPEYDAENIPASIDYPLSQEVTARAGMDFMHDYLHRIRLENQFCGAFDAADIHRMMLGYDPGYAHLLINLYEQTLVNALGCVLSGRPPRPLALTREDRLRLQARLSPFRTQRLEDCLTTAARALLGELHFDAPSLREYVELTLPRLAARLGAALQTQTLERLLVTPVTREPVFEEGQTMERGEFQDFLEELASCRYSSDKLAMIQRSIHSLRDTHALLESGILSSREMETLKAALTREERRRLREYAIQPRETFL